MVISVLLLKSHTIAHVSTAVNSHHNQGHRSHHGSGGGTDHTLYQHPHYPRAANNTAPLQDRPPPPQYYTPPLSTSQLSHIPSLAMGESMAHLAATTSHTLEQIWHCATAWHQIDVPCNRKIWSRRFHIYMKQKCARKRDCGIISEARREWENV
mmetsp:Transcript_26958/g.57789  ORF Transcript_26958/g.57789 Transcript_26958/m.57789 type:complete len:154 (-) Transcript_26958:31-492(-)